jgi:hypothetical protein
MVKNTGDHNASRLVKIQISTPILKFRSAALLGRFRRPRCGSKNYKSLYKNQLEEVFMQCNAYSRSNRSVLKNVDQLIS